MFIKIFRYNRSDRTNLHNIPKCTHTNFFLSKTNQITVNRLFRARITEIIYFILIGTYVRYYIL